MLVGTTAFVGQTLRSNPRYRFQSLSSLSASELKFLDSNVERGRVSGILIDRTGSGLSIKAISPTTALAFELFSKKVKIGILDDVFKRLSCDELIQLVLESVLEIEIDGQFVSGQSVVSIFVTDTAELLGQDSLALLSQSALLHGQRLSIADPLTLSARLYFYNRIPLSSQWLLQWPDQIAILSYFGIRSRGSDQPCSLQDEFLANRIDSQSPWISWRHWNSNVTSSNPKSALFKLYVSPVPEDIRKAFEAIVECLPNSKVVSLKIGATTVGLLRPDKIVLYFDNYIDLVLFAKKLEPYLDGLKSQGVPFTSQLDKIGLLSWGIDPTRSDTRVGENSWRQWICNLLAAAIVEAKLHKSDTVKPWQYALVKSWLSGVDTRTWHIREAVR